MKKVLHAWDSFWFSPLSFSSLKKFWILSGAFYILFFISVLPHWNAWFVPEGILSNHFYPMNGVTLFALIENTGTIFPLWISGMVAAIAYSINFYRRISGTILLLLLLSMIHRNPVVLGGGVFLIAPFLFYSLFLREGGTVWPVRLMQLHVCLIYFLALNSKLRGNSWASGEFMYEFMINPMWSHWPWPRILYFGVVTKMMSWSVLTFQATFPIFVWHPVTRKLFIILAILFHVLIAVFIKQVFFLSLAMITALSIFVAEVGTTSHERASSS